MKIKTIFRISLSIIIIALMFYIALSYELKNEKLLVALNNTYKEGVLEDLNKDIKFIKLEEEAEEKIEENEDETIEEVAEEEELSEEVGNDTNSNIVFDGLTLDELAAKLERNMNSDLKGYGYKFASYATSLGVDPYLSLAIVLEETGCRWECSGLVKSCNNIGGMKGSGCGEYQAFGSLDEGIEGFLNNIYKNYFLYGLTTADTMNPKYAENPLWARNVNAYIERIKNN